MIAGRPLTQMFGSSQASVLEVLLRVDDQLSVRQIARLSAMSPPTASKALQTLESRHIVVRERRAAAITYRMSPGLVYRASLLKILSDAEAIERDFGGVLAQMLEPIPITGVILFGSAARGDDTANSDVDVLALVDRREDVDRHGGLAADVERRASEWLGRKVQLLLTLPPTKQQSKQTFWREVEAEGKLLSGNWWQA